MKHNNNLINKLNILVIDDDVIITTIVSKLFEDLYNCITLNNTEENIFEILENENISLILLDVQIPYKDGFEVATKIKENIKFNKIPIIFITSDTSEETVLKAFEHHAVDYIKKPFNKNELKARVKTNINNFEYIKKIEAQQEIIHEQVKETTVKEMLSKISHHWRQPLASISLNAQKINLDNKHDMLEKEEVNDLTESIIETSQKLSENIDFFSKIYCTEGNNKSIDLIQELNNFLDFLESLYGNTIEFIIENRLNIDKLIINKNLSHLKNVLISIINNCAEAYEKTKDENSKIVIIELFIENNVLEINISDFAGGIDENIINNVFDPYFSTKDNLNGMGLGLFISKNSIENKLNGTITLKNIIQNNKKGTQINCKIPIL